MFCGIYTPEHTDALHISAAACTLQLGCKQQALQLCVWVVLTMQRQHVCDKMPRLMSEDENTQEQESGCHPNVRLRLPMGKQNRLSWQRFQTSATFSLPLINRKKYLIAKNWINASIMCVTDSNCNLSVSFIF